jgi:hypothetical protein
LLGTVERVEARSGSCDLHFHELRHKATTRIVSLANLSQLEVARFTSQGGFHTLVRYCNPEPVDILKAFRASRC